ncbi:hypothetical protein JCM8097_001104 [Rhodosporidiobolus ruineniae]
MPSAVPAPLSPSARPPDPDHPSPPAPPTVTPNHARLAPPVASTSTVAEPKPPKPRRHVQWNEQPAVRHVRVDEEDEQDEDDSATDDDDDEDEAEAAVRAAFARAMSGRRRSSTASALSAATGRRRGSFSFGALGGGGGSGGADDHDADDPFDSRYRVDDVPISLAGGQEDGALDGVVSPFANQLEVWIDPLERDGLPSLAAMQQHEAAAAAAKKKADEEMALPRATEENGADKAKGLVSQAAKGGFGLWEGLRKRRDSIRRLGGEEAAASGEGEKLSEKSPATALDRVEEGVEDVQQPPLPPGFAGLGGPGILAALMALNQQEAALASSSTLGTPSSTNSALPTPSTSTNNSPQFTPGGFSDPDYDSSDDEVERERFIAALRRKRATKNAFHAASSSFASAGRHAASAAWHAATGSNLRHSSHERGRSFTASSRSASASTLSAVGEERSLSRSRASSPTTSAGALSPVLQPRRPTSTRSTSSTSSIDVAPSSPPQASTSVRPSSAHGSTASIPSLSAHQRSQSSTALSKLVSRVSTPSPPVSPVEPGHYVPHRPDLKSEFTKRVRKLGDRLGLELESERTRPAAARSGAGVFGGLVLGTASLVAPATPAASSLAPLPTRPGYNLSRYSAPDVKPGSPTSPVSHSPTSRTQPSSPGPSPPRSPGQKSFDLSRPAGSRMSLSEMVTEEEELEKEGSPSASAALPPPVPLEQRRREKKAVFSLQLNDLPSVHDDEDESDVQARPSPPSRRPSLSISTTGHAPSSRSNSRTRLNNISPSHTSPSPTSASGTFRFFGPRTPGTASPLREYFGSIPNNPAGTPAQRDHAWVERKMKEDQEREAREREYELKEWRKEKKRRQRKRVKELKRRRVFITAHVAAILERQDFILKLARSFMMFGAPTHRLEAQIQATARVLELPHCTALYLPNLFLVNFGDPATMTSDIKFLKQPSGLDFGKLKTTYWIYNRVIRDKLSVTDASVQLDELMTSPPLYTLWQHVLIGGLTGAWITPSGFGGSFIDCLIVVLLGMLLVLVQVVLARNDMTSSLFEIVVCCINAVIAGALSYTDQFCFYSIAAGSIVLILPGYIFLLAALEVANRSVVSGSVRLTYAALYCLLLGFGLSAGAEIYTMGGREEAQSDYTCAAIREGAPWYRATIPRWWYFLTIPCFLFSIGVTNGQPMLKRDTLAMVVIGCAGFATNFFSGWAFVNQPAITSALGAFVVGVLGNVWSRMTRESAFVVMIVGLFVQLPSGLANGGLISFAQNSTRRTANNFSTAISAAAGLIRTIVGITVGLFAAAALVNLLSRRGRRRGAHLSTF